VDSYHKLNSLFLFLVSRRKQTVVKSATKEEEYVVNISGYEKYDYEHTLCWPALVKRVTRMILSIKMNAVKKEIIISLALLVFSRIIGGLEGNAGFPPAVGHTSQAARTIQFVTH
jgi:hypothetical protein